ncbi:MAG: hypothetical protein GY826_08435, partial [Fuerstiella sp.]|nr:hypothetical protein [Fuerstiella sp.]
LLMLLLAIVGLLTVVKVLAYAYLEELTFRTFGREFRRSYYGREMLVTIVQPDSKRNDVADSGSLADSDSPS